MAPHRIRNDLASRAIPGPNAPRILFIGAGSQGHAYAEPIVRLGLGHVVAVADPIPLKRQELFGQKYIWGIHDRNALPHEEFEDWQSFVKYEIKRRERLAAGEISEDDAEFKGVDSAFICVLDEMHVHVIKALVPLGIHIMCEKPLATTLEDCTGILGAVTKEWEVLGRKSIFGIGHVLRYSSYNVKLRQLVREQKTIGDLISIEHTEPIGWWHMAHSFVRGNWRRQDTTGPILLTKSCHDIDFLMWLVASPTSPSNSEPPHLPSYISSSGHLNHFRKARKPAAAGNATNCLSCPIESTCIYSSKNIYINKLLDVEDLDWPLPTVVPEIEDIYKAKGKEDAKQRLLEALGEDYTPDTPDSVIKQRPWFGRCVWECDNDVNDDQTVTISWEDDPLPPAQENGTFNGTNNGVVESRDGAKEQVRGDASGLTGRAAKTAIFHMTAPTELICERRGRIYGTTGEITYDSTTISVHSFATGKTVKYVPEVRGIGHGGGDEWLAENFCKAVEQVNAGGAVEEAQKQWLGVSIEEIVRSHVAVFAAERARTERSVVDWRKFWREEVERHVIKA
ncbi:streptomycin biosynthesis protein StrI [Tothia fuscella]|uniref:Streptomycin biosynthesis protein StrI n=1 Tax=Tothia fuscella TaxID=1048955 RepID=A0A9P4NPV7_9PEZI|nr:streptomycin biosynthesis protein StrI [Tothia fuscella]